MGNRKETLFKLRFKSYKQKKSIYNIFVVVCCMGKEKEFNNNFLYLNIQSLKKAKEK